MGDKSEIAWTDATWNPFLGCSKVSPGCKNCYAMQTVYRMSFNPNPIVAQANAGLTKKVGDSAQWTGKVRFLPERLKQPQSWTKPRMIFVNSLSDIGHPDLLDEDVDAVCNVMRLTRDRHVYQVLSKRADRLAEIINRSLASYAIGTAARDNHIWWGVTVENQAAADERLPALLGAERPAGSVRWASVEPLLGPVNLRPWLRSSIGRKGLSWVVVGGESGRGARPLDLTWVRDLRDQCREAGVPFFVKQTGPAHSDKFKDIASFPEDLQIREMPNSDWALHQSFDLLFARWCEKQAPGRFGQHVRHITPLSRLSFRLGVDPHTGECHVADGPGLYLDLHRMVRDQITEGDALRLYIDKLGDNAFDSPTIKLRSLGTYCPDQTFLPSEVIEFHAPNGAYFTHKCLVDAIVSLENQTRKKTNWFGGIDTHHVYYEGLCPDFGAGEAGVYEVMWGS